MSKFKLIPDWRDKNLKCYLCGETRSVKYAMKVLTFDSLVLNKEVEVCVCNRCVTYLKQ
jgi:formate dehydrogenase maturation protein FdhE